MRSEEDSNKHLSLIKELIELFRHKGYIINSADGIDGFYSPVDITNNGYGDQEDKAPDVYAFDEAEQRYIIGEAKTGANDIGNEHALTQYNIFLNHTHPKSKKPSLFYIILPVKQVAEFNSLITHYIHPDLWNNLVIVQSKNWLE